MKEKISDNKILISMPLILGILSLLSFVLYYYSCHHAPYKYISVILLGPVFSFAGMVISIITRKSRNTFPTLWISGVISCLFGFIICVFIFIIWFCLMAAKLQQ